MDREIIWFLLIGHGWFISNHFLWFFFYFMGWFPGLPRSLLYRLQKVMGGMRRIRTARGLKLIAGLRQEEAY